MLNWQGVTQQKAHCRGMAFRSRVDGAAEAPERFAMDRYG